MSVTKGSLAGVLLVLSAGAQAASNADLEARIQQLERKLDSRSLVNMHEQVTALQREVQQLRGDVEVQAHTLDSLQKRQRDLYLDIDRRLHRIEAGGVETRSAPANTTPSAAGTAAVAAATTAGTAASVASTTPPPAQALNPADQRKAYDQALELLKEGRYEEASTAFEGFLKQYPDSSYSDNAQYWLGEVYYVTRKFDPALAEFNKVLTDHPGSGKAADARLKMGYIYYEQQQWTKARDALTQVVKTAPGTTSARLAQERLDRIKQEGH